MITRTELIVGGVALAWAVLVWGAFLWIYRDEHKAALRELIAGLRQDVGRR